MGESTSVSEPSSASSAVGSALSSSAALVNISTTPTRHTCNAPFRRVVQAALRAGGDGVLQLRLELRLVSGRQRHVELSWCAWLTWTDTRALVLTRVGHNGHSRGHGPLRRGNYCLHRPPPPLHPSLSLHSHCLSRRALHAIRHADHHQRVRERLAPHKGRPPGPLSTVQAAPGLA
jgi:hypothetical protein